MRVLIALGCALALAACAPKAPTPDAPDVSAAAAQSFMATNAKAAEFDIMIETRDGAHTEEIVQALAERGYPPRPL